MIRNVLSIAGSDPSGGAGIQADLKTFAACRVYGMAALTALTAQNTQGVSGVHALPAEFVAEQIAMVFADIRVDAVKIGMIANGEIAAAVAEQLSAASRTADRARPGDDRQGRRAVARPASGIRAARKTDAARHAAHPEFAGGGGAAW